MISGLLRASLRPLGLRRAGRLLPSQLGRVASSSTSAKTGYVPLPRDPGNNELSPFATLDEQVLKPLYRKATDRESAVDVLEELERRLDPEKLHGSLTLTCWARESR
jgi:hypothetical protein